MKKNILLAIGLVGIISYGQVNKHDKNIDKYVDFLENKNELAKDYVLDLFKNNDLVILCERDHRENTQYDFISELISDPRFVKDVGNVFTEIGMSNLNPELNEFIHAENLPESLVNKKLIEFQRKASFYPLWEKFNFYYLNQQLYKINQSLSNVEKINIYPTDVNLKLDSLNANYYKSVWNNIIYNRDSLVAQFIIDEFENIKKSSSSRKKALIIMNYRHAFNTNFKMSNGNIVKNVGGFLFKKYPKKIANVLINQLSILEGKSDNDIIFESTLDGKWDATFELLNKDNIGFNFKNSPFGEDYFDLWPFKTDYTYQNIFTGFVYYKKPKDFKLITGVNGLIDSTFIDIFKKRALLWKEITNNRINYPLDNDEIYDEFNLKRETSIELLDSISNQINKWIIK